jgi:hypothetical protein
MHPSQKSKNINKKVDVRGGFINGHSDVVSKIRIV